MSRNAILGRSLIAVTALALALAISPSTIARADEASELTEEISAEVEAAEEAQDAVDALAQDMSEENLDAVESALSQTSPVTPRSFDGIDPSVSIQYRQAQLMLLLSQQNKDAALQHIEQMRSQQELLDQIVLHINDMRDCTVGSYEKDGKTVLRSESDAVPADLAERARALGATVSNTDTLGDAIHTLEVLQEEFWNKTDPRLVIIQDYMGQYNNYAQGASSAVQDANDLLASLGRGTVDSSSAANSTYDELGSLYDEQMARLEEITAELETADDTQRAEELRQEQTELLATLQETLELQHDTLATSKTATVAGSDTLGLAALGAGAGAVVAGIAVYVIMRRRAASQTAPANDSAA